MTDRRQEHRRESDDTRLAIVETHIMHMLEARSEDRAAREAMRADLAGVKSRISWIVGVGLGASFVLQTLIDVAFK